MEVPWDKIFMFVIGLVALILSFYAMVWYFITPEMFLGIMALILASFGIGVVGAQLRRDAYRAGYSEGMTFTLKKEK